MTPALISFSPMTLHPLSGHEEARHRLASAFQGGRLPQVLLFTGPAGIGKQRLGLWLGQLLLCQAPGQEPCGKCQPCRLVLGLAHPDLHWFVPIPRPKAGELDKQVEEAAELLAEAMAARREEPRYGPVDGMHSHSLASARLLLRRAALTPAQGKRKVFLIGEADRLVPQESSPDAANALLKLLEEPPADTWVILTTTEPERVLPTIRSRATLLRLTPGRDSRDNATSEQSRAEARALLDTLKHRPVRAARFERALKQAPWSARGGFTDLLDAMAVELETEARNAPDRETTGKLTRALERVQTARTDAQGNLNPQLLLAVLSGELAELL